MDNIWNHASIPSWANFLAKNGDGKILAFECRPLPYANGEFWCVSALEGIACGSRMAIIKGFPDNNHFVRSSWAASLIIRPGLTPESYSSMKSSQTTSLAYTTEEQALWDKTVLTMLPTAYNHIRTTSKPEAVFEYAKKYADMMINARRAIKNENEQCYEQQNV